MLLLLSVVRKNDFLTFSSFLSAFPETLSGGYAIPRDSEIEPVEQCQGVNPPGGS